MEDAPSNKQTNLLGKTMKTLVKLPGRNSGLQTIANHFFSLYKFLLKHADEDPKTLSLRITQKGKPMFSEADMRSVLKTIQKQRNSRLSTFLTGSRGGNGAAAPAAVAPAAVAPAAAAPAAPAAVAPAAVAIGAEEEDPTRNKFWDKFMHKIGHPIQKAIPPSWDGVLWYLYILYHVEQMEFIGPMIGTALDTVTLSLPVAAELCKETLATMIALAPIPYASFVGDAVGYAVSLALISFAVLINASRKHFGSGFKASLEAIPIFGDVLMDAAQSVETGADRYLVARKKLLKNVDKVSPHAEDFLDYYTPDVKIKEGPAPKLDIPMIKAEVIQYAAEESGALNAINAITGKVNAISAAATTAATTAAATATNKVKSAVNSAVKSGGRRKTRKNRHTSRIQNT